MELHSPAVAKKLWNLLRVAFFMMRKGFISKRKLILDLNLMMKRGKVIIGKSLGKNLIFNHHYHWRSTAPPRGGGGCFGLEEYEFSCSNSPNPVFSHVVGGGASNKKSKHHYFPCINAAAAVDEVIVLPEIEYSPPPQCSRDDQAEEAGEMLSPLPSPFSAVRVSNYSSEDEGEGGPCAQVDAAAEEFIRRFYEQLRSQSRVALLQFQEMEYQEMLARGTR